MSNYHGMQLTLKKRFGRGFMFNGHDTFAKAIEQGGIDNMTASSVGNVQDHRNIRASRGLSLADIRHNFSLDHSWDIPFEKWFRSGSGVKRQIAAGWQLFGILSIRSGSPFFVTSGRDNYGLGTTSGQRADRVLSAPVFLDGYRDSNTHQYVNRAAFADPCDARGLRRPCGVFGNTGSFGLSNPGSVYYDMSVFKNIMPPDRLEEWDSLVLHGFQPYLRHVSC